MPGHEKYIRDFLKSNDPERYLATLYLPEDIRQTAMTLYAFDAEISRIPDIVSEPMPGEIRIQWWRDLIKSDGNTGSGPLAEELLSMVLEKSLPRDVLDNYLEAKIFDLYQDPMPDMNTYEGYLGETVSCFFHMLAIAFGETRSTALADACGHAGVATGITRHISTCARTRVRGQIYFPLSTLGEQGLVREAWLAPDTSEAHVMMIETMVDHAMIHLKKAQEAISSLPNAVRPVFLPIVFASDLLSRVSTNPARCLQGSFVLSPLRRQWLAFRGLGKL